MSYWKFVGNNAATGGLATASDALKAGADWRTVGMAAAIGSLAGVMQSLMQHNTAQHPVILQAAAAAAAPGTGPAR